MIKSTFACIAIILLAACTQNPQQSPNSSASSADSSTATTAAFKPANIKEQMIYQRGVEAAVWGIAAVNFQLMYDELAKLKQGDNQIVYWPGLLTWKNQTLTPNPDVIYIMPFFNTKEVGPVVLEIPAADSGVLNGSVMNYWQAAIEDIGPGGVDKGKGGKYIILPPGFDKTKVPKGFIPLQSDTYQGYALIRSVLKSGSPEDVAKAKRYSERLKLYPLSQASTAKTSFEDASGGVYDSHILYDFSFYESLNKIVQAEPFLERDRAMIDPLKTIGIERGKPFNADARKKEILSVALKDAKSWLELNYSSMPPFYEGTHWFFPAT